MPRSASLLLRAARTHKREDRLTELLAVVLDGHLGFANRLLGAADLEVGESVKVRTQVRTASNKRVDLEVVSVGSDGSDVSRLWSEHKTGSEYSPGQLPSYARDLAGIGGAHQLITVVDHLHEAPRSDQWQPYTWRRVAVMAWEAGRDAGGPDWRKAALKPDSLAHQRLLLELLSYLEEEHGTVIDPVTHVHVAAYAKATETQDMLYDLLERAAEECGYDREDEVGYAKDDFSQYWQVFNAIGTWAQPLDGYPELTIAENDHWSIDRVGEPAFGAGFTLPGDLHDQLRSAKCLAWRERLEGNGVTVAEWEGRVRVYRTLYLAELIPRGPTIDAQSRAVARWADESFALVAAADPNVARTPPLKRARAGAAPPPDVTPAESEPASEDPAL